MVTNAKWVFILLKHVNIQYFQPLLQNEQFNACIDGSRAVCRINESYLLCVLLADFLTGLFLCINQDLSCNTGTEILAALTPSFLNTSEKALSRFLPDERDCYKNEEFKFPNLQWNEGYRYQLCLSGFHIGSV